MTSGRDGERSSKGQSSVLRFPQNGGCDSVGPFLIGTAIGGVAGAVAGTLLSDRTRRLLVGLIRLAGRRLSDAERDELRFELLLQ